MACDAAARMLVVWTILPHVLLACLESLPAVLCALAFVDGGLTPLTQLLLSMSSTTVDDLCFLAAVITAVDEVDLGDDLFIDWLCL